MTEQTTAGESRQYALRPAIPLLVGAAIYLFLLPLGSSLLNDADTYWHVAIGRWIVEHGALPTGDPFSHTMRGAHWIAFEWLSQLAYAGAHALGGWPAVAMLASVSYAIAFGLLARLLLRELPPLPALIMVAVSFALAMPHMLARPHAFAFPILVIWAGTLVRTVDLGKAPPLALLPLMVLWANTHGSFTLGLALIGPVAFEAFWNARPPERMRVAWLWLGFALLAIAAACLTPYGPEMFLVTYRTLSLGEALSIVVEWRPQDFGRLGAFEVSLLFGIGYALHSGLTLPPLRILALLGLLHLALWQTRHADLLALLGPLFLAAPLASWMASRNVIQQQSTAARAAVLAPSMIAAMILAVAATSVVWMLMWGRNIAPHAQNTPSAAVAAASIAHAGPVLNDYRFGGYLDYIGIAPFIDGRAEVYGRDLMLRHHNAISLQDIPGFLRLLDQYRIQVTLLAPSTPAIGLLDRLPEWRRVYADEIAVVHKRQPGASAQPSPSQ
jgi:hypothetical protein